MSLSAEDKPPDGSPPLSTAVIAVTVADMEDEDDRDDEIDEDDEKHSFLEGHTALKFLLAGGIAGAGAWTTECDRSALTSV